MRRPRARTLLFTVASALVLAACGTEAIELDDRDKGNARIREGAALFTERCSGCHALSAAGTQGSATKVRDRERTDGPNFDTRPETVDAVLYAIRNGGFSGAIMPENIVVGDDARKVAEYLSKYAGRKAEKPVSPSAESG